MFLTQIFPELRYKVFLSFSSSKSPYQRLAQPCTHVHANRLVHSHPASTERLLTCHSTSEQDRRHPPLGSGHCGPEKQGGLDQSEPAEGHGPGDGEWDRREGEEDIG